MYIVSKKERVHLMKLVILSGSGRKESNNLKLGQFILGKFQSKALEIELIDLCQYGSLLHHYEPLTNQQLLTKKEQLLHSLYQCDGLIIIAPEWGACCRQYYIIPCYLQHMDQQVAFLLPTNLLFQSVYQRLVADITQLVY